MVSTHVAGIDVSKATLDVCLSSNQLHFRVPYTRDGLAVLAARLDEAGIDRVVLEASGGLELAAARSLAVAGLKVCRINPERIFGFRKSLGQRAKTDKLDAALIARFAQVMDLPSHNLPSPDAQAVRELAARRRQLVEMIAAEKNRLKQTTNPSILRSLKDSIASLAASRQAIEAELQAAIQADPALAQRFRLLCSIPGVGPVVATTLITDLPELGELDRRAIASLAGVAPHPEQSGTSQNGHRLRSGRPCVRAALYMAALTASRANSRMRTTYRDMTARGKAPKQALVAIARKLVTVANQMIRTNEPWTDHATAPA